MKLGLCYGYSVRMFENGLLGMIIGSKREGVTGKYVMRSFMIGTLRQILFG